MTILRLGLALLVLTTPAISVEEDLLLQMSPHSAKAQRTRKAHASEGTAAMKSEIIAKTKQFAEAMESLNTEDVHAMKKDFNNVFAMYQDDLAEYTTSKKHASLAHSSEGTAATKAAIIAKTQQFAEAMESLNTEDVD